MKKSKFIPDPKGPALQRKLGKVWGPGTYHSSSTSPESFQEMLERIPGIEHWVFQLEQGEQGGLLHYQFTIVLNEAVSFNYLKEYLPEAHLELSYNRPAAWNYCKKERTRVEGPWSCECCTDKNPFTQAKKK